MLLPVVKQFQNVDTRAFLSNERKHCIQATNEKVEPVSDYSRPRPQLNVHAPGEYSRQKLLLPNRFSEVAWLSFLALSQKTGWTNSVEWRL
mmetsp:Transcript_24790/g.97978  ORF Transcript_24790/g.97978 Transcript_24790/m.97978 type:complete len:91 (-) Transcript_24790:668-940(-)